MRKVHIKRGFDKYVADPSSYGGDYKIVTDPDTGQTAFAVSITGEAPGFSKPFGDIARSSERAVLRDVLPSATQPTFF
ncbi:hypothetical protein N9F76_01645 [bacterium]|nr:hypothetical protein [bacterium]